MAKEYLNDKEQMNDFEKHLKDINIPNINIKNKEELIEGKFLIDLTNNEKLTLLNTLVCNISTTDIELNTLLNKISNFKPNL